MIMSHLSPASNFVIVSSSEYESTDSATSSSAPEGFTVQDNLSYKYTQCCQRIEKYTLRKAELVRRIKALRSSMESKLLPPPQGDFPVQEEPRVFARTRVDDRLYSEVVQVPTSSDEEVEILNVPIVKTNIYLIRNLQRQINITNWRLEKQNKLKVKLNKVILNQVAYSPVFNPSYINEPIYNETTVPITEEEYVPFPARPTSVKAKKCRTPRSSINDSIYGVYVPPYSASRNVLLAIKLRVKIRSFRNIISNSYIKFLLYHKFCYLSYPIFPQMDAHGESISTNSDKKLNTVIETQRESSEGASRPIIFPQWQQLVSSDHFSSYPTSTNRWTKYKTVSWTNNKIQPVDSISIPSDLLKELVNTPVFIPFRNNRYWKGDFEFKFVLNSNKFQQGSLQLSFMYCADLEQGFNSYRSNIYSASQTNHCLLNAGSSNEGILKIPFKYFNPVITTNPSENVDYCKIFMRVLNPLLCTSSTYNACDITIFINLDNAYFTGSIDFSLINNPQMFHLMRALIKTTEFGLNQIDPDVNRDNPPDVCPPSSVMLTNTSSWSSGTDSIEPVNHLRLSPLGQTPHPNLMHDELKTNVICRIFGLLNTLEWKFSHKEGDILLNLEAAPMAALKNYYSNTLTISNRTYSLYALPPVAVISNLFAYWRGSLELRLDFVSTSFHTGSLLIAYIPGIKSDVTIDQARSSNYVVCSLQENQSYTIRIPYISNSPSWPRKYNKSYKIHNSQEINPPGSIQIFVLNPLIPLDNVHSSIHINYYLRAGTDFEVFIPIQPNISTPYNLDYKDTNFNHVPLSNSVDGKTTFYYICAQAPNQIDSMIVLTRKKYDGNEPVSYESLRDGNFDGEHKYDTDLNPYLPQTPGVLPYYFETSEPLTLYLQSTPTSQTPSSIEIKYFVPYNELCRGIGYTTLWPVLNKQQAIKYARSEQSWSDLLKLTIAAKYTKSGDRAVTINITYLLKIFVHVHEVEDNVSEFSFCDPNNEERSLGPNFLDMTQNLASTSHGTSLYGEYFNDLKDYCRRYQYYTNVLYKNTNKLDKKQAIAIIPLVPQGLVNPLIYNDNSINHIVNRCKDGFIPIISSGYRFYRGGLRLRIVSDNRRNINLWVQHRPEMLLKYLQTHLVDPENQSLSDYFNHSYSFNIQNLELNNVVSIEIPWYSKNMLGCSFLPKVQSSINDINSQKLTAFSLGSLVLGLDAAPTELKVPINLEIFYSIADDFHFNTFQGFPLMLTLDQIPSAYDCYPQMGLFSVEKVINNSDAAKKIETLTDKIDSKVDKFSKAISDLPKMVESYFFDSDSNLRILLSKIFFDIIHIIVNPNIKTVIVTVLSLFTSIGIIAGEVIFKFYKLVKRLFKRLGWNNKESTEADVDPVVKDEKEKISKQKRKDSIVTDTIVTPGVAGPSKSYEPHPIYPQADDDEPSTICAGIISLIWAGLNTLLNVSFKTCDGISDYVSTLMDGMSKATMQANTVFRFVKNCFAVIEKCYKSIVNKIYSKYNKYQRLKVEEETLQEWLDLCDCLLSPINSSLVQNNLEWREAVYCAARYGHIYLCKQKPGVSPRVDVYIRKVYDKIINLRDSLQTEKLFPSLRMEAYGLWIDGAPGIGKSSMITRLTTDLLSAVDYKGDSNLIFNVTPLDKYWNNCNHQPVISIDDAFAITTPECIQNQLWTYFTVMSPVPLIPPMAEIKDKKMHYNPEIMVTCSNDAFPRLTGLAEATALYRRRHQLIKAQLKDPSKLTYPFGCTDAQLKNFEHLEFFLAEDVRDPKTKYGKSMTYLQLIEFLQTDFKNFKKHSAYAYEERKRLQFSMMTDAQAKKLPENVKIMEYLRTLDTDNAKKLVETKTEVCDLKETYKLIDQIQKNPNFTLKITVKVPKIDEPSPTIEQVAENIKNESNEIPEPQMDEKPLTDEQLMELAVPPTPEEKAYYKSGSEELKKMLQEKKDEVMNKPIPGLDQLQADMDADMENVGNYGLSYRVKFSDVATLLVGIANRDKLKVLHKNPLIGGLIINNETPNQEKYNQFGTTVTNQCFHRLISRNCIVRRVTKFGVTFPVWDIPVKWNKADLVLEGCIWSSEFVHVIDTPCQYEDCLVRKPKEWLEHMTKWLSQRLGSCPWLLEDVCCPIVQLAAKDMSTVRRFVNKVRYWVVRTIKFCIYDIFYKTTHFIGTIFSNLGMFLSGLAATLGIIGVLKCRGKPSPQLVSSGDSNTNSAKNNVRKIIFNSFNPQSSDQESKLREIIGQRIVKNTVYIRFDSEKFNKRSNMKCLVIKERFLLVLRHYIEYLEVNETEESSTNLLWCDNGLHPFNYKEMDIKWCPNSNLGLLRLPNWFNSRKSLLPFISNDTNFYGSVIRDCNIVDHCIHETYVYEQDITLASDITIAPTSYSKCLVMPNAYAYRKNYAGMCGSVLLNNKPMRPIIGIHVAGANNKGFSEPICVQLFEKYFEYFEGKLVNDIVPIDWRELDCKQVPIEDRKLYLNGTHKYLGSVDNNIAKYEMGISSIVPSTIQGIFPVGTEPGPLTPKDPRINNEFSPLLAGCEKHCNPTIDFNKNDLALAEKDLNNLILSHCKPIRLTVQPLTEMQAINGIDGLEDYRPLVWNTSEGFYLSRLRPAGARDKRWLFNFNDEGKATSVHPNLREILDSKHSDRLNNIVPLTIHDDCLKDSRLPLHKIKVPGKVRVFSISPVDFTIQFRQYFLDFIAAYTKARFNCEHAIGINVHGLEWTELAKFFEGKPIITGDYSGFGPTLNSETVAAAFRIINNWYKAFGGCEEDGKIRLIMSKELINAKHLMGDYLYEVSCGLPSGNPATVIFNSLVNSLYLRCAWLDIMSKTAYRSLFDQRRLMKIITYGDDLIASLDPSIVEYFNNNSLSYFFKKHNITFTDAAKTGTSVDPYISLETATFLKHSFKPHPKRKGVYLAQLEELSVTECANWVRKSPDLKQATYDNCVQGSMLAYGHGPEYYDAYVEKISKAWFDKYQEEFLVRTWDDLDVLFLDQGFYFDW